MQKIYLLADEGYVDSFLNNNLNNNSLTGSIKLSKYIKKQKTFLVIEWPQMDQEQYFSAAGILIREQVNKLLATWDNSKKKALSKKESKEYNAFANNVHNQESLFEKLAQKEKTKKAEEFVGTFNWLTKKEEKEQFYLVPTKNNFFDLAHNLQKQIIGFGLKETPFFYRNPPNVHTLDPYRQEFNVRRNYLKQLGLTILYLSLPYEGFIYEWYYGLIQARAMTSLEDNPLDVNYRFPGCLFPREYRINESGHPRLIALGTTTSSMKKSTWKKCCLNLFAQRTKLLIWELDFSNCHMRVFNALQPKTPAAKKYFKSVNVLAQSYWDKLADEALKYLGDPDALLLNKQLIRLVCKITFLAMLNGARPGNETIIVNQLKDKLDSLGNQMTNYSELISRFIINHTMTKHIKAITGKWTKNGKVQIYGSEEPYSIGTQHHKLLSALYCGPEMVALTLAAEYALNNRNDIILLSLEADGMLVASQPDWDQEDQTIFTESVEGLITIRTGIIIPVKLTLTT